MDGAFGKIAVAILRIKAACALLKEDTVGNINDGGIGT
jgi:hypothetical protein